MKKVDGKQSISFIWPYHGEMNERQNCEETKRRCNTEGICSMKHANQSLDCDSVSTNFVRATNQCGTMFSIVSKSQRVCVERCFSSMKKSVRPS